LKPTVRRRGRTFDALLFWKYEGERLVYVARTRVGLTPASRMRPGLGHPQKRGARGESAKKYFVSAIFLETFFARLTTTICDSNN
jgi:hypothetical protein